MFLKRLTINNNSGNIREITFKKGINLIVDETPESQTQQATGNNVGKTTVLRLIDYCLGSKGDTIYKDTEFGKQPNTLIENFLTETKLNVTLDLVENLDDPKSKRISIRRNFLKRKEKLQEINGTKYSDDKEFDQELKKLIFDTEADKPTFRQIVSKNIRIEKDRMNKIVRVLGDFAKSEVYEALYFFWLGISTDNSNEKQKLTLEHKKEETFRNRLKREGELPLITQKMAIVDDKIAELEKQRSNFNLNENYVEELNELDKVKSELNNISSEISHLKIRRDLIYESRDNLEREVSNINVEQIRSLYSRAKVLIPTLQLSFEETLQFHNDLIFEKLEFITKELPELEQKLKLLDRRLLSLTEKEEKLTNKIRKSGITEDLETKISELNKQYELKGKLEELKRLWEESNEKINRIESELALINSEISSNDFLIQSRVTHFNKFFTKMSERLYGEDYILTPVRKGSTYDLMVTNIESNPSTGKKKGQIAAFDFSYILFADDLDIRCLHFILHDQLENIHDNQLNTLVAVANSINGQYIVPILRDKIPPNIDISQYEVLSLSQEVKLFKL